MKRNCYGRMGMAVLLAACLSMSGCAKEKETGSLPAENGTTAVRVSQDADGYVYESRRETVYATGDVNIRAAATSQSEIIDVLKAGTSVTRIAYNYSWSKVLCDGRICYVASQYLTTETPGDKTAEEPAEEFSAEESTETQPGKKAGGTESDVKEEPSQTRTAEQKKSTADAEMTENKGDNTND